MAIYKVTDTELTSIANAIRTKGLTEDPLVFPTGFVSAVQEISGGEAYVLSGIHGSVITGTSNPTSAQGDEGDIYLKLLDHDTDYATVSEAYIKRSGAWSTLGTIHLPYTGLVIAPFSSATDEQIVNILEAAHTGVINLKKHAGWNVGDVRSIPLSSFTNGDGTTSIAESVDIVISSFDEYMNCGNVMQFDFKDCLTTPFRMCSAQSTAGGWGASEMYLETMPNLVNALPAWLRGSLISFDVLAQTEASGQVGVVQNNKLALRSKIEVYGVGAAEGSRIEYYAQGRYNNGFPKSIGHGGSSPARWWTRSIGNNAEYIYCERIDYTNNHYAYLAERYVAPFGCL